MTESARLLARMKCVSRRTGEHVGQCPFCATATRDAFHIWTLATNNRPADRYWCRKCDRSGLLKDLDASPFAIASIMPTPEPLARDQEDPRRDEIPIYRAIYTAISAWAEGWLHNPVNPNAIYYVERRGLSAASARRLRLGYALDDPQRLVEHLTELRPDLAHAFVRAGVALRTRSGGLLTHYNLRGALLFPTLLNGQVVDLRSRRPRRGEQAKSLPGGWDARGASTLIGLDQIAGCTTVIVTESGEFKAAVPLQAFWNSQLSYPTLGHPGLSVFRPEWASVLSARGVREVILAYDSSVRQANADGLLTLTGEELATIKVGAILRDAGIASRVLRLPLEGGASKADLDGYILGAGPERLQTLIDQAPTLETYQLSLPKVVLARLRVAEM